VELIPAIDLRGGRCVRLVQGDYDREFVFSDDPVAMAEHWLAQGAPRLHVVDLDGAREGRPVNDAIVERIIQTVDMPVQVAGGIRDLEAVERWMRAGADRVVLGTAAVRDPDLASEAALRYRDRVIVSLDARDGRVATEGWREATSLQVDDLARRFAELGVRRIVYTDIGRDGMLESPNYEGVQALIAAAPGIAVIAAGGVAVTQHLVQLAELGVEGAIIGRALYDGGMDLRDALAAVG
jgi:phosphoribosylformimino-5-aminoimidazole carboxamide ribotide isomerase